MATQKAFTKGHPRKIETNYAFKLFNAPKFFCQSEIQDGHHLMTKFYDGTLLEISL
jgi:hypothetical protein